MYYIYTYISTAPSIAEKALTGFHCYVIAYPPGEPFTNMVSLYSQRGYIHYKVWNEIINAFPNFNSAAVEI